MKKILIPLVIVVFLGTIGFRISGNLERYTKKVEKPVSRRAQEDPYLAFRRWAAMNQIVIINSTRSGDEGYDAIIIDGRVLQKIYFPKDLGTWVYEGGKLTIFLHSLDSDEDFEEMTMFVMMIISSIGLDADISLQDPDGMIFSERIIEESGNNPRTITVDTRLLINVSEITNGSSLINCAEQEGVHMISAPVGRGRITLMGQPYFLGNDLIGEFDNGSFAWDLISPVNPASPVTRALFVPDPPTRRRSPLGIHLILLLASWVLALAVLVWRGLARRDSVVDEEPAAGSDIGGRLAAEGNFLMAHGSIEVYLHAARNDAFRRLRRKGLADGIGQVDFQALEREIGFDRETLKEAFEAEESSKQTDFIKKMRIFHAIKDEI